VKIRQDLIAGFFGLLVISVGTPLVAQTVSEEPVLSILVYNYSAATPTFLGQAEKETQRIFSRVGVSISWTDCPIQQVLLEKSDCYEEPAPGQIRLRILKQPLNDYFQDSIFGFAVAPVFASVYYGSALRLAVLDKDEYALSAIMGCLMAHEVGHLLLGENRHSASGIMKAQWDLKQVQLAMRGSLGFLPQEKKLLYANAIAGRRKAEPALCARGTRE